MSAARSYLGMADEEFLNTPPPDSADTGSASDESKDTPAKDTLPGASAEDAASEADHREGEGAETAEEGASDDDKGEAAKPASDGSASPSTEETAADTDKAVVDPLKGTSKEVSGETRTRTGDGEQKADGGAEKEKPQAKVGEAAATDYEAFYKRIMAPFKANGKTIELRSPEEAIQLMQMGANYTRKTQELGQHRKAILMLENNGLLDEGKLSYLIDLDKKNPEAIRKLIKDAGIDPMEIDTTTASAYRAGDHKVTDEEATFRSALDDMKSSQPGMETLQTINTDWDQSSKELLWKSPEVMQIIHQQRESGIYNRIVAEMTRQKTLGQIAASVPFLQAYKTVGDQLVAANGFADLVAQPGLNQQGQAVATRVAAPKAALANNDKARAASSSRTSAQASKDFVNPLSMSDDDFLKQMKK